MMNTRRILIVTLVVGLSLALAGGLYGTLGRAQAQEPAAQDETAADVEVAATLDDVVPVQGRLTDASGNPLNGSYSIRMRIYDASTGGSVLCEDTDTVNVSKGLFSAAMDSCTGTDLNGEAIYLGIKVGTDAEMTPRQPIYAVPYAWSLRPGAEISGTLGANAILDVQNYSATGRGLRGYALATNGENYGVVGASESPAGYGGYFYNNEGGIGLYASSNDDAAIRLGGSGILRSSAKSYLWVSGNGVRPAHQADSTVIDMDAIGGARILRGATSANKTVVLPITVMGPLYGQNVKVTDLDIYWVGDNEWAGITDILLRRQTGVCATDACYETIVHNTTDRSCDKAIHTTGCVQHLDLTTNNVLTADSGVLYLAIEFSFDAAPTSWVELGGVRLTLEHD